MSSDGQEEREFQIKLRDAILAIGALQDWIQPEYVQIRDDMNGINDEKFSVVLIVLHDFMTDDQSHAFGISGKINFHCSISVIVNNSERKDGPLPANQVGISSGPSLSTIDGALRNAFHVHTLSAWCWDTTLGPGLPIATGELREGWIGRRYPFVALKEVQR
jgi:hypothetical protein